MRFYFLGEQIQPEEIEIGMLETMRLQVDRTKDLGVDWPEHIKKEITLTPEKCNEIMQLINPELTIVEKAVRTAFIIGVPTVVLGLYVKFIEWLICA